MVHFSVRRLWKMKKNTEHWTVSYIDNDIHASDVVGGIDADNDDEADDEDDDDDNDDETDDDDETEDDIDDEIEVDVDDETDDVDDVTFAIVMLHEGQCQCWLESVFFAMVDSSLSLIPSINQSLPMWTICDDDI